MIEFTLPAKKGDYLPIVDLVKDVTLTVQIRARPDTYHTHEITFLEKGELVAVGHMYVHIPSVISRDTFLQMWLHLLLDRSSENSDPRINSKRLSDGGRVIIPPNLGYPSLILTTKDDKHQWCLTSDHLVWPERRDDKLPMLRKNGVRIVQTSWPTRDIWTNFGITQDQLCVELWGTNKNCLARYFCPLKDHLTREQVAKIHLNIPLGTDVFDHVIDDYDDREKFRLDVRMVGPLVFMASVDGELKALASTLTYVPKALHVIKILFDELTETDHELVEAFRAAVVRIIFGLSLSEHAMEQQLLQLCFQVVERLV